MGFDQAPQLDNPVLEIARRDREPNHREVLAIDYESKDNASGAFAEALRLADRYRVDFPDGELSPEAEVVAIEALVAEHARQAASARAARFLARYPGDPHAARVKWLVR